jgi:hypothetical protein
MYPLIAIILYKNLLPDARIKAIPEAKTFPVPVEIVSPDPNPDHFLVKWKMVGLLQTQIVHY